MPLLEYRCGACSKRTEELVLAGDAPHAPACAHCGSLDVSRLLSTFAAHSHGTSGASFDAPCGEGACGMGGCGDPGACGMGGFDVN